MPLTFTDFSAALSEQLVAYQNRMSGADPQPGTELYARAALGAAAVAQYSAGLSWVRDQVFADSADTEHLERWAALYGLARLAATSASGTIRFTGVNGTAIAIGQRVAHADGVEYDTTANGVIAGGILDLAATAVIAGSDGNKSSGEAVIVQSPPAGCDGAATLQTDFSGGSDIETDAELRARVLERLRNGNGGGTAADYERWAGAVDGIVRADCIPIRRGPGTVTVAVFEEGPGGWRSPAGAGLRTEVEAAIEVYRPAAAEVDVAAPLEVTTAVTVALTSLIDGYDSTEVIAAVEEAIEAHIYGLLTGETLYRTRLAAAISIVPGVLDFTLTLPAANVSPAMSYTALEILVPGVVTVTA